MASALATHELPAWAFAALTAASGVDRVLRRARDLHRGRDGRPHRGSWSSTSTPAAWTASPVPAGRGCGRGLVAAKGAAEHRAGESARSEPVSSGSRWEAQLVDRRPGTRGPGAAVYVATAVHAVAARRTRSRPPSSGHRRLDDFFHPRSSGWRSGPRCEWLKSRSEPPQHLRRGPFLREPDPPARRRVRAHL